MLLNTNQVCYECFNLARHHHQCSLFFYAEDVGSSSQTWLPSYHCTTRQKNAIFEVNALRFSYLISSLIISRYKLHNFQLKNEFGIQGSHSDAAKGSRLVGCYSTSVGKQFNLQGQHSKKSHSASIASH